MRGMHRVRCVAHYGDCRMSEVLWGLRRAVWTAPSVARSDVPERASGSIELSLRTGPESTWRGDVAIGYDSIAQSDFEAFSARALLSLRF